MKATTKITNQEKFDNTVESISYESLKVYQPLGGQPYASGSIIINDNTITGDHGLDDYQEDYGFVIWPELNTKKISSYEFSGTIFRNIGEVLGAAIEWHFDDFDGEVSKIHPDDLEGDIDNIADNLLAVDFDAIEWPNGDIYTKEELQEAIEDKIKEDYKRNL